jgi:hypothetical protein
MVRVRKYTSDFTCLRHLLVKYNKIDWLTRQHELCLTYITPQRR